MVPVFGCETARELLEPFVDGELSTSQQVAVQSHLRTCPTCQARIADMSLIGWSLRTAPQMLATVADGMALSVVQSGVLARVHAEREQSFRVRMADLFSDMRLLWPALGATTAMLLCLVAAGQIWRLTMERRPNSVAALIDMWALPGTDQNPLRIDNAVAAPRVLHGGMAFYGRPERERMVTLRVVVTRDGRVSQAEVVASADEAMPFSSRSAVSDDVLNAVRKWHLAPAQSRAGEPVAVQVVYMYWQTTAVKELVQAEALPLPRAIRRAPKVLPPAAGTQSSVTLDSTTV
jgi:anti-sigma factor RsiW